MLQSLTNLIDLPKLKNSDRKKYSVTEIRRSDETKVKEITILEKAKKNVYQI